MVVHSIAQYVSHEEIEDCLSTIDIIIAQLHSRPACQGVWFGLVSEAGGGVL